ncbi:hypothetical protein ACC720_32375 [Rhizobium ruizarguesonis]
MKKPGRSWTSMPSSSDAAVSSASGRATETSDISVDPPGGWPTRSTEVVEVDCRVVDLAHILRTTGIWDELTDDERLAVKHARAEIEMVVDNESLCALSSRSDGSRTSTRRSHVSVSEHAGDDARACERAAEGVRLVLPPPVFKPVIEAYFSKMLTNDATHVASRSFAGALSKEIEATMLREYRGSSHRDPEEDGPH